jgi:hypothetical protein
MRGSLMPPTRTLLSGVAIAVVVLAVFAGVLSRDYGFDRWYRWYTHDRHVKNVVVTVTPRDKDCTNPDHPLGIDIKNNSGLTIERTRYSFAATRRGRSTNIIMGYGMSSDGYRVDDHVISPGGSHGVCLHLPRFSERVEDPWQLEWSIDFFELFFRK